MNSRQQKVMGETLPYTLAVHIQRTVMLADGYLPLDMPQTLRKQNYLDPPVSCLTALTVVTKQYNISFVAVGR